VVGKPFISIFQSPKQAVLTILYQANPNLFDLKTSTVFHNPSGNLFILYSFQENGQQNSYIFGYSEVKQDKLGNWYVPRTFSAGQPAKPLISNFIYSISEQDSGQNAIYGIALSEEVLSITAKQDDGDIITTTVDKNGFFFLYSNPKSLIYSIEALDKHNNILIIKAVTSQ
jgi:hypothetical protein